MNVLEFKPPARQRPLSAQAQFWRDIEEEWQRHSEAVDELLASQPDGVIDAAATAFEQSDVWPESALMRNRDLNEALRRHLEIKRRG